MYVVGGSGYVGSALVVLEPDAVVVSRDGTGGSLAWPDLLARLPAERAPLVVWLLDGAKHDESARLAELIGPLPEGAHVVFVSTCTVYGNTGGASCTEETPLSLITPHAKVKAAGEAAVAASGGTVAVLRFGALYGPDRRGLRRDRVTKWLAEAHDHRHVTVPDPGHCRGWLHVDQAARALLAAARERVAGTFNVSSADATFGDAAGTAADLFGADVVGDSEPDPLDYRIDATRARTAGLLTERSGEDLAGCTVAVAELLWPGISRQAGPGA